MSDWIIIPKPHLEKIKKTLPKIAGVLRQLELAYDRYSGKKNIFFIISGHFYEDMEILTPEVSLDWNLDVLLNIISENFFHRCHKPTKNASRRRFMTS